MSDSKLRAIDLFCGVGGSSFGASKAGVEIVAGFDLWDSAITAYSKNFPNAKVYQGNLCVLSTENIRGIKSEIGNVDLILASPECTNHSRAKGANEINEASRETAFEVIRFAREFKPPWIIIENVVEMQNWNRFKNLLEDLWSLGYFVRKVVLNAKDFGVPQSRERLFLLCSLSGKANEPVVNTKNIKPASTIIEDAGKYSFTSLKKPGRAENTIASANRAITALGNRTPFLLVYYGSGRRGNGGWQKISEPLGTVTTLDRFAYVIPAKHGHKMRMLQPEELKLAMGFTSDFQLDSIDGLTRRVRIKLMGNGVCPPVMEAIVNSLIKC